MKCTSNPLRAKHGLQPLILNIAHRGARAFAPENTLAAFAKAHDLGCQMFELDVHLTKDRELIVHHDDTLTRCTNVAARFPRRRSHFISNFDLGDLMELDAGSWYAYQLDLVAGKRDPFLRTLSKAETNKYISAAERDSYRNGKIKLPTLRQALAMAQLTKMMVNIEIKTIPRMYGGIAKDVVGLVQSMNLEDRVLISSFDHEQLLTVRRLSDVIAIAVLTSDRLAKPAEYLRMIDADAYNPGCYGDFDSLGFGSINRRLDSRGIQRVRGAGRGVNVWTCNDKRQMRQLIRAGVTGLISDYPNRTKAVLKELFGNPRRHN